MTWIFPAVLTVIAFLIATAALPGYSYFRDIGPSVLGATYYPFATILSLVAWLVWALV